MGGARVTTLVTLRKCTLGHKREIKTLKFVSASTKGFKGGLAWIKPSKKDMAVTFSYSLSAAVEFPACPSVPGMVLEGPNATCSFLCFHCCRIPDGQSCSSRRDVVRLRHLPPPPSRGGRGQKSSACTGCVSVGCAYHRAVESRAQRPHTATCRIVAPAVHMARAPALRQACQRAPSNGDPTRRRCMPFSSCCVVHGRLPSAAGSGKWRWSHRSHSLVSGVSDLCCQSCLVLESKNRTASSTTAQGCRVIASPTRRKSWNKRRGAPRDGEGQCAGCDRL